MQAVTGTELCVSAEQLFAGHADAIRLHGGVLAEESRTLLAAWRTGRGAGRP